LCRTWRFPGFIQKGVNQRQRVSVLDGNGVEPSVIDAKSKVFGARFGDIEGG